MERAKGFTEDKNYASAGNFKSHLQLLTASGSSGQMREDWSPCRLLCFPAGMKTYYNNKIPLINMNINQKIKNKWWSQANILENKKQELRHYEQNALGWDHKINSYMYIYA